MKKNFLKTLSCLLLFVLLFSGCKKDLKETNPDINPETKTEADLQAAKDNQKNECRMISFATPEGGETFHYNRQGLCDEWTISDWGTLKQEYDNKDRLKKSRIYDANGLFATIRFFYTGKNVTKEIWYYGNTDEVYDEVHYIFNHKGQNVRMESAVYDYHTINIFDAEGNIRKWDFYSDGIHVYSSTAAFNYRPFFKNPRRAIPGIEYGFPFLNAAIFGNPECISTEKLITFDEGGIPVVLYDYDPQKTSYQQAAQNYPSLGRFFDRVTNAWTSQTFQYEHCGGGHHVPDDDANGIRRGSQTSSLMPGGNKGRMTHILHPALKGIKARMNMNQLKPMNNK